jgi:hypothetical protein
MDCVQTLNKTGLDEMSARINGALI